MVESGYYAMESASRPVNTGLPPVFTGVCHTGVCVGIVGIIPGNTRSCGYGRYRNPEIPGYRRYYTLKIPDLAGTVGIEIQKYRGRRGYRRYGFRKYLILPVR